MIPSEKYTLNELEKKLEIKTPSIEQRIAPNWLRAQDYQLFVKRDDLIHPIISGNKWRKLKYQLLSVLSRKTAHADCHVISFGGGYSNHIHALAYCCHQLNIRMTANIRGDYSQNLTPMLVDIEQLGCEIKFVTKSHYKRRNDDDYLNELKLTHPSAVIIPEGGSHELALPGISELVKEFNHQYDIIICPVASAGTFAGLIKNCTRASALHGIAMLKGRDYLESETMRLLPKAELASNWQIHHNFHCGGYARKTLDLVKFCQEFESDTNIPIEPVYSGKMLYALKQLVETQYFPVGAKILAIHTGGLQGKRQS